MSLTELISAHAANNPHKPAILSDRGMATWAEFERSTNRIAHAIRAAGLQVEDKVASLMGNGRELVELIFGSAKSGATYVPISGFLTPEQVAVLVNDAGARLFFVSAAYREVAEAIRAQLPSVKEDGWIAVDFEAPGWRTLGEFVDGASDSAPRALHAQANTACLWYSSGTTGLPKGIIRSHQSLQALGFLVGVDMNIDSRSVTLIATPLSASGTWINLLSTVLVGGTLVVPTKASSQVLLDLIGRHGVTHAMMVPTQLNMLLDEPALETTDCSSLRGVLSLGSKLHGFTKTEVLRRLTPNLFELYGLTEGFGTLAKPHEHSARPGSVGKPILGCEFRIIDENDREVPAGVAGEIVGIGPFMMGGYHNRPEETAKLIWKDERGRVFLKSGDVGRKDEEGFVYILDRHKDMIVSGGMNVYPADMEAVLGEHQDVVELVVIGLPHAKWGEVPIALVKLRQGCTVAPEELMEWANGRLAKHQRLKSVIAWEDFPRNALGKLVKHQIRAAYLAASGQQAELVA